MAGVLQEDLLYLDLAVQFNYQAKFILPGNERKLLQGPGFDWNKWLPVQDVDPPVGNVATRGIEGVAPFAIPYGFDLSQMSMNFLDSVDYHIKRFFEYWMNNVVMDKNSMTAGCLFDVARELHVTKYKDGMRASDVDRYFVFPFGGLPQTLSMAGNEHFILPVTFAVVGDSLGGSDGSRSNSGGA